MLDYQKGCLCKRVPKLWLSSNNRGGQGWNGIGPGLRPWPPGAHRLHRQGRACWSGGGGLEGALAHWGCSHSSAWRAVSRQPQPYPILCILERNPSVMVCDCSICLQHLFKHISGKEADNKPRPAARLAGIMQRQLLRLVLPGGPGRKPGALSETLQRGAFVWDSRAQGPLGAGGLGLWALQTCSATPHRGLPLSGPQFPKPAVRGINSGPRGML